MRRKAEVLAPAGSIESMKAAILYGADAVYMGGSRFGARAYAENPEEDQLLEAIDYVHFHEKKLYLTVNTLLKEKELTGQLYDYMARYYERGLDAAIVQDVGVFSFLKREFPDLPLHISTQMTLTGPYGARFMEEQGASRAVLARELSLEEIKEIREAVDLELEVFVHGAICYCYSGQCLFSSMLGGRSGNRGRCAQPCRLPYEVSADGKRISQPKTPYVMNLKDMCTLELLPELLEAGADSLKIEGRMKSPLYTAGVTGLYRKYVDLYTEKGREGYRVEPEDIQMVSKLFDRGGYTSRYFTAHNGKDMISPKEKPRFRETDEALFKGLEQKLRDLERSDVRPLSGQVFLTPGQAVSMTLTDETTDISVTVTGAVCEQAQRRPITEDAVKKQLSKTGGTGFVMQKLTVTIEGDCFLPLQALNELRRAAIEELKEAICARFARKTEVCREIPASSRNGADSGKYEPSLAASLENTDLLSIVLAQPAVSIVELEAAASSPKQWKSLVDRCHRAEKEVYLSLPRMFRKKDRQVFETHSDLLKQAGFDGFLLRNMESFSWIQGLNLPGKLVADDSLYTWNKEARSFFAPYIHRDTVPLELHENELQDRSCDGSELWLYGRAPLMITANCLKKTCAVCDQKTGWLSLKDRKQMQFPVKTNCSFCYNTIYNSLPLNLFDQAERLRTLAPAVLRIHLTTETAEETKGLLLQADACRRGDFVSLKGKAFTRGHFKRGAE